MTPHTWPDVALCLILAAFIYFLGFIGGMTKVRSQDAQWLRDMHERSGKT